MIRPPLAQLLAPVLLLAAQAALALAPPASAQFATQNAAREAHEARDSNVQPPPAQTPASTALKVCSSSHSSAVSLNLSTPRTLISPDEKWKLLGVPGKTVFDSASVFIESRNAAGPSAAAADKPKKWRIDWLHHRGAAWFSDDSRWLVFRDEFAKDDTALRAFDLSGDAPREIHHLDDHVRRAIQKQIPKGMAAEWVKYPDVCFADGAPNTFLVLSDTPVLPRWSRQKGKPFFLHIEVTLPDATAVATPYTPKPPKPAAAPVLIDDSGLVQPTPPKPEPKTEPPPDAPPPPH
jgi:hypothetical protein